MPLIFIPSQKGQLLLLHNGVLYSKRKTNKNNTTWLCTTRNCKVIIHTDSEEASGNVIEDTSSHNHPNNAAAVKAKLLKNKIKRISAECNEPVADIISDIMKDVKPPIAALMPKPDSLARFVQRARAQKNVPIQNTYNFDNIEIKDEFKYNTEEEEEVTEIDYEEIPESQPTTVPIVPINSNSEEFFFCDNESSDPLSNAEQSRNSPRDEKPNLISPLTYTKSKAQKRKSESVSEQPHQTTTSLSSTSAASTAASMSSAISAIGAVGEEEECDVMGKQIAVQLRQLPVHDRLRANFVIQKVLMDFRLRNSNSEFVQSVMSGTDYIG